MAVKRCNAAFDCANADRTCTSAALLAALAAGGTAPPPSVLCARRGVLCAGHTSSLWRLQRREGIEHTGNLFSGQGGLAEGGWVPGCR